MIARLRNMIYINTPTSYHAFVPFTQVFERTYKHDKDTVFNSISITILWYCHIQFHYLQH